MRPGVKNQVKRRSNSTLPWGGRALALAVVLLLSASPLAAQSRACARGLAGALCRLQNTVDKADSAAARRTSGGPSFQDTATVGPATPDTTTLADPTVEVVATTRRCGVERQCVAGYDLRVLRVTAPDSVYGVRASTVVSVELDNRGRAGAPPTDLVVTVDGKDYRAELPALASGAKAIVRVPVRMPTSADQETRIEAAFDLEATALARDGNVENNRAVSREIVIEYPRLVWQRFDSPAEVRRTAPIALRGIVRNASRAAMSPPTDVSMWLYGCLVSSTLAVSTRRPLGQIPALAPGGTFAFTVIVHPVTNCQYENRIEFAANIDSDDKLTWGGSQRERRAETEATLR